jgi:putative protease
MAAIQAGAGSVYFGVGQINMRSRSSVNFTEEDLKNITTICRENRVLSYLTVNTIVYNHEIDQVHRLLDLAKTCQVSAIIASDWAVMNYCKKIGMEIHISTQCNVTNFEALKFYSQFADVVVLAREVTMEQVAAITQSIREENICGPKVELIIIEMFIHGALCMAVSGKCYISLDNFNHSANRGACLQPCRRGYSVKDLEHEVELNIDNQYIMSPKDLCTIGFLDKILKAGVTVLKIEGRGRPAEYVKTVTQCYHEAIDAINETQYTQEKIAAWTSRLRGVYNRDFWDGYYLGRTLGEWSQRYGSQATKVKEYIGKVTNFFKKSNVAEIQIETGEFAVGDTLLISGTTTGVEEIKVEEIRVDLKTVPVATKGDFCSIITSHIVRRGDKVYKWNEIIEEF